MSFYRFKPFDPVGYIGLDGQENRETAGFGGYMLQIIYQTNAGAVILTDFVYWMIICPYRIKTGHNIDFWNIMAHSINSVFLLGDAALNSMCFPWFRMAYFVIWTGFYVLFQWMAHASTDIDWWPYPFLDLSSGKAPLWYLLCGLIQLPCYFVFVLAMKLKHHAWSKWFPATFIQADPDPSEGDPDSEADPDPSQADP